MAIATAFERSSSRPVFRANGVDLCVQEFGAPTDPGVLLLCGAASSIAHWSTGLRDAIEDYELLQLLPQQQRENLTRRIVGGFLGRLIGLYPTYQSTGGFFMSILGAVVILVAVIYVVANLLVDIAYTLIDPRLKTA